MYTPEEIKHCFDAATLNYLQNKNRGDSSGQKGARYEDYFAVYKLVKTLIGAWVTNEPSTISGQDLLTTAQSQSPQYIRGFKTEFELDLEVVQILRNIENFQMQIF